MNKTKQENGRYIEDNRHDLSYTEFVLDWADINNIDLLYISKYLPQPILDKIKSEALSGDKIRPSVKKQMISPMLDI